MGIPNEMIVRESQFPFPYEAPEEGYENQILTLDYYMREVVSNIDSSDYVFRIRTVINEDGKIESTLYGRIEGPILVMGNHQITPIKFIYLLNPTPNDRNLEPARNERGVIIPFSQNR